MRGSAALRASVAPGGALAGPWVRDELWRRARAVPSLDLRFAENKSLVDATTGQNLVTFSRASGGTYVDSQGVIRPAVTNLLLRSEEFGTTWVVEQGTVTTNQATAPNGTVTADDFEDTGSASGVYQLATITANTIYTASIYLKRGDTDWYRLYWVNTGFTSGIRVWVNLATGALGTVNTIGTASNQSGSIASVGDGWYRVSVTGIIDSSSTTGRFQVNSASADNSGSRVINANAFLWGAQLEQSTTVGEYIPTGATINSAPRFDHNPVTGESLGLLVEEQRTNFTTQSETFSGWTVQGLTQTTESIANPAGTTGAQLFTEDTATGSHRLFVSPTTGQLTHSLSIWVKPASGTRLFYVESDNSSGVRRNLRFNLQAGTVDTNPGDWTGVFITSYANGWFRVGGTITDNGGSVLFIVGSTNGASASYTGDGTSGFYLWGAQLEAGAFATSYIPTGASAVTRSADVCSISGSNFSSWYNQAEGTVFADATGLGSAVPGSDFQSLAVFSDGTNNTRIELGYLTANSAFWNIRSSGSSSVDINPTVTSARRILAGSYSPALAEISANGAAALSDSSVTVPTVNKLDIGGANAAAIKEFHGTIRRLTYWPTRLGNEVLQRITQ
jgi:hypothetical protein